MSVRDRIGKNAGVKHRGVFGFIGAFAGLLACVLAALCVWGSIINGGDGMALVWAWRWSCLAMISFGVHLLDAMLFQLKWIE